MLAAADWVAAGRDELNRINVFPVPDGDTGTNMCLTLRAVAGALRDLGGGGGGDGDAALPLPYVAETMAQASVRGARGNSGMMLSQFLLGFREGIGQRLRINARELAVAIGIGFERLRSSLDEPMEGTILTVAREAADEAGLAGGETDLRVFMSRIVGRAEAALQRIRAQSGGLFTVDNFERLARSGRLGRGRAWLGTKLDLKPVMALTMEGKIEPVSRVRGRDSARRRILELLDRALTPRPRALRLGVAHGDIPEFAEALRVELVARYRPMQCLVTPITPVIAAHAGIGAWGVFYQNED